MRTCYRCKEQKEAEDFYIGQTYCKSCQSGYFQENKDKIQAQRRQYRLDHPEAKTRQWEMAKTRRICNREKHLWRAAKDRAAKSGISFSIEVSDIVIPELCPLLQIPLTKGSMSRNDPNAPSLDRVDNSKGYIPGNVKVISYKANFMKSNATKEELETFYSNIFNYLAK
jgi:hypothetical protein